MYIYCSLLVLQWYVLMLLMSTKVLISVRIYCNRKQSELDNIRHLVTISNQPDDLFELIGTGSQV